MKSKLADEIIIYTSNEVLGNKGKVKISPIMKKLYNRLKNNYRNKETFENNTKFRGLSK